MNPLIRRARERGFTLLIAVIFVSVFLALALAISTIGYKQAVLASVATQSQFAFYAAESVLECALYYDEQKSTDADPFSYENHGQSVSLPCGPGGVRPTELGGSCYNGAGGCAAGERATFVRIPIAFKTPADSGSGETLCADLTIYKYNTPQPDKYTTYIFSQGYNVPCSTIDAPGQARIVARGLQLAH